MRPVTSERPRIPTMPHMRTPRSLQWGSFKIYPERHPHQYQFRIPLGGSPRIRGLLRQGARRAQILSLVSKPGLGARETRGCQGLSGRPHDRGEAVPGAPRPLPPPLGSVSCLARPAPGASNLAPGRQLWRRHPCRSLLLGSPVSRDLPLLLISRMNGLRPSPLVSWGLPRCTGPSGPSSPWSPTAPARIFFPLAGCAGANSFKGLRSLPGVLRPTPAPAGSRLVAGAASAPPCPVTAPSPRPHRGFTVPKAR